MNDLSNNIFEKINLLDLRIEKGKQIIFISDFIKKNKGKINYSSIFYIRFIINRCLQCGNYRRACKYLLIADKLMDDLEENSDQIISELTKNIIK